MGDRISSLSFTDISIYFSAWKPYEETDQRWVFLPPERTLRAVTGKLRRAIENGNPEDCSKPVTLDINEAKTIIEAHEAISCVTECSSRQSEVIKLYGDILEQYRERVNGLSR